MQQDIGYVNTSETNTLNIIKLLENIRKRVYIQNLNLPLFIADNSQ